MRLYSFCGIKENGEKSSKNLSDEIDLAFKKVISQNEDFVHIRLVGSEITRKNILEKLKEINSILSQPNQKVIVFYNGHGDQCADTNGDEEDGKDEYWKPMGGGGNILDDEISTILCDIHETSFVLLISDNCSSGTMIDKKLNNRPWICMSSCRDNQDSLASSDGGVFTLFGLIPAIKSGKRTASEIFKFICSELEIPSQTPYIETSREYLLEIPLF